MIRTAGKLKAVWGLAAAMGLGMAIGPTASAAPVKANVMILLDTSGSMGDLITALPAYSSATVYASVGYSSGTVYVQNSDGSYSNFATSLFSVADSGAQSMLLSNGFWIGTLQATQVKLFLGNYLNYQGCTSCATQQTKISIAKRVIKELVTFVQGAQFGVMKFVNNSTIGSGGGGVVSTIGTSTATIVSAVNAINPSGWTPLGEQLRDAGSYFSGTFGFPSPITTACQPNATIIISDGLWNGTINPATQATTEYTADHAASISGLQNLITNTVGFSVDPTQTQQALASLQQTAANGHGNFYVANDAPQLEQALFSLPPAVSVTQPLNGSILSGTVTLAASVQTSNCVAGIQFKVDGNPVGSVVTVAPYSISWNTTLVANGTHAITAASQDLSGNVTVSYPVNIAVNNQVTLPVITGIALQVNTTSTTISWQTNVLTDAQVLYGLTAAYGQSTLLQDTSPRLTAHTVVLNGLSPATQYHFEAVSHDASGNLAVLGDLTFTTQGFAQTGPLDHFRFTFLNGGTQTGPGTKSGTYPYVLNAGDCFSTTIEGVDAFGNHSNFNGSVTLGQYLLDSSGLETTLAPGIALRNNFLLGVSSMSFNMINGFLSLGSATDVTNQLCFYRATREPLDSKQPGAQGDLHLRAVETNVSSVTAISDSYVVWRGSPKQLALAAPSQTLAAATPSGMQGSVDQENQGVPFVLHAYLTDQYWNPVTGANDTLRFSSSLPTKTGFSPFSGALAGGTILSTVTVSACNSVVTLSVDDVTSSVITSTQSYIQIASCGNQRYYDVAVPTEAVAGIPFPMTITVHNLNIPFGGGSVLFSGNLLPLVSADAIHFSNATGGLAVPIFSFNIPEGTVGNYTFTIPNQMYLRAESIYIELAGGNPTDLQGATSVAGPMVVDPGAPAKLTVVTSPVAVGAFSQASIIATVTDSFGNGVPGQAVSLQLLSGSGGFGSTGSLLSQTLNTGASGQATFSFRSGGSSENDTFIATAPTAPGVAPYQGSILVSLLNGQPVAAYPSPAKITQQPLTIEYLLAGDSDVRMIITDLFGREVWRTSYSAGSTGGHNGFNRVTWNGVNGIGRTVAVGVYGLHLEISSNGQTKKVNTRFGIIK